MRKAHVHEISLIPTLLARTVVCSTTGDELLGPGRYSMPCSGPLYYPVGSRPFPSYPWKRYTTRNVQE